VFLLTQTDVSGGGWAEPVFQGDLLTGITVSQSGQKARVIPAEIINAYLERALSGGTYRPFPVFGVRWQVHENPSMAGYLGQDGDPRGALIRQVPWGSSGCGVLEPMDVLLSLDGRRIEVGGFYQHPRLGSLEFTQILMNGHDVGDVVPVEVLRDGEVLDLEMTLRAYPAEGILIPLRRGDRPPPYLIAGGLVLRELDGNYMRSWGKEWTKTAPLHLLTRYYLQSEAQKPDRRRIVLLTSVLPAPYNVGYESLRDLPVEIINGRRIDSVAEAAEAFRHPRDGFHTIVLEPNTSRREIVLDAERFESATAEILEAYRVPEAMRLPAADPPAGGPVCPGGY
jgi:hypothetical protein